jgi:hypothetical protein
MASLGFPQVRSALKKGEEIKKNIRHFLFLSVQKSILRKQVCSFKMPAAVTIF